MTRVLLYAYAQCVINFGDDAAGNRKDFTEKIQQCLRV